MKKMPSSLIQFHSFIANAFILHYFLDPQISQEAIEQLKKELEGVIQALNKRLEELQDLAKEQEATIRDLEQEGDDLRAELREGKDVQEKLEDMEQKLECK
jgi:DNA repair ATPase RecN